MGDWRLYWRYLGVAIRSQMQYRWSFVLLSVGAFVVNVVEFVGIWALFNRFGMIRGWRLPEIALLYGMVNVSFSVADAFARGFDVLDRIIRSGDFDRLLLRPRSLVVQVAGREFAAFRIGRLMQGLLILVWAARVLGIRWTPATAAFLPAAILAGSCLFAGLFVLQATLAFWTVESLEVANVFTYGGVFAGQYPLSIYRGWFRRLFTFVIPLAAVNYFPALAILGRRDEALGCPAWFGWVAPLAGILFLAVTLRVWRFGVAHYRSTGS
jgi:ABC-2 type transport system permease protein